MINRFTIVLLFLFLQVFTSSGQSRKELTQYGDSLYRALKLLKNKEAEANALFDLSFFWSDHDSSKAFHYIREAEQTLGASKQSAFYQGLSHFYRAAAYFEVDATKAKQQYTAAARLLAKVDDEKKKEAARYRARAFASYGALLQREGKAQDYVKILVEQVIPLAEESGDATLLGNNYQNIAINLMNLKEYATADVYYKKALALLAGSRDAGEERLTLYVNAGRNALFAKDYPKAKILLDSAALAVRAVPNSVYIPMYHAVVGTYYVALKDYQLAHKAFESGLSVAINQQNEHLIAAILFDQVKAFQSQAKYANAKKKLLEVLPYVENSASLANKKMVYQGLATTSTKLKQFEEAVAWHELHNAIADTLFADRNQAQILELERKFQTTEKEKELLRIKSQHQEQDLALQKTRTIATVAVSLSLLLLVIALAGYRMQLNRKKLLQQKELLLEKEIVNHEQRSKIDRYNAMMAGEEQERGRLARDLHDGLGGMLANVKMKLSAVTDRIDGQALEGMPVDDLRTITVQLDRSVQELRRVARNLMPDALVHRSLEDALKDLCKAMSQAQVSIDFQSSALRSDYTQPFLIAVYRMVQELLTNALKHSQADQIWVQCRDDADHLFVSVEDNGRGFDYSEQLSSSSVTGMGLSNIRNRVALLNGQLDIDTAPNSGMAVHIQLPHTNVI